MEDLGNGATAILLQKNYQHWESGQVNVECRLSDYSMRISCHASKGSVHYHHYQRYSPSEHQRIKLQSQTARSARQRSARRRWITTSYHNA